LSCQDQVDSFISSLWIYIQSFFPGVHWYVPLVIIM
jgi:hypothetical protein